MGSLRLHINRSQVQCLTIRIQKIIIAITKWTIQGVWSTVSCETDIYGMVCQRQKSRSCKGFWGHGRVGSARNVSLHLDNKSTGTLWCDYFGNLKFIEFLKLPGEVLDSKLWLISVSSTLSSYHHSSPISLARLLASSLAYTSGA